jgi:hypothetical protein
MTQNDFQDGFFYEEQAVECRKNAGEKGLQMLKVHKNLKPFSQFE